MAITTELVYKDFDYRFMAHPITGKLVIRKNAEAIKQAFKCLILTSLGERPYRPTYGSATRSALFENFTPFTEEKIRATIETAAKNFEPRVELLNINFFGDPDAYELGVSIYFRPINGTQVVQLDLQLQRVR